MSHVPYPAHATITFHDRNVGRETRPVIDGRIRLRDDPDDEMLYPALLTEVEQQLASGAVAGVTHDPCYPEWRLNTTSGASHPF